MNTQQRLDSLGRPYNAPTGIGARGANADEIQRVMNERHVSVGAARDIVRARIADEIVAANPVPANQKAKILASLLKDGKAQTVADLRKRLLKDNFYIDPHNLVHVLWSIQKDAHITFRQRRQSPVAWEGDMTSIRLNTAGTKAAQKMLNGAAKAAGEVAMAEVRANTKNLVQSSRIGTGRLDEKAGKVATGGPIEREFQPRELTDSEQPIEVPIETAVVMIQDEHMPPTDDRYIDSETVEEILAEGKRLLSDSETFLAKARSTHEPPIDFFVEYPLIGKMLNRQSRIESAAKILEEEGELDLAAQTLEKITYSPFEREVLRLVQKMNA